MDNYVPFLKFKPNEIIALGELDSDIFESVVPFFDYPRPNSEKTDDDFISDVERLSRSVKKHISNVQEMYLDTYDYDHDSEFDGKYSYYKLIESIENIKVIPVVSIDRSQKHINSVLDLVADGVVEEDIVALRFTIEDFMNYEVVKDEILEMLSEVFEAFDEVDLLFDCRVCTSFENEVVCQSIYDFAISFGQDHSVRKMVVTGSSIPASISEVLSVNSEHYMDRKEIQIYRGVVDLAKGREDFIFGDYATVSPNYSDVNVLPEMMQNIMTAKLTYSFEDRHFFIRGGGIRTNGYQQYFDLAEQLVSKDFFRGEDYSTGDAYFEQKSRREGSNCMPGTIIKPSVNAHITYIVRGCPI